MLYGRRKFFRPASVGVINPHIIRERAFRILANGIAIVGIEPLIHQGILHKCLQKFSDILLIGLYEKFFGKYRLIGVLRKESAVLGFGVLQSPVFPQAVLKLPDLMVGGGDLALQLRQRIMAVFDLRQTLVQNGELLFPPGSLAGTVGLQEKPAADQKSGGQGQGKKHGGENRQTGTSGKYSGFPYGSAKQGVRALLFLKVILFVASHIVFIRSDKLRRGSALRAEAGVPVQFVSTAAAQHRQSSFPLSSMIDQPQEVFKVYLRIHRFLSSQDHRLSRWS